MAALTSVPKVAVTLFADDIVTVHVPVPAQSPDQPAKVESADGVAVKVTEVPELNEWEQAEPQLIPEGSEVTVPTPAPESATVRRYEKVVACADFWPELPQAVRASPRAAAEKITTYVFIIV